MVPEGDRWCSEHAPLFAESPGRGRELPEESGVLQAAFAGEPMGSQLGESWYVQVWPVERDGRIVVGAVAITPLEDAAPSAIHEALDLAMRELVKASEIPPPGLAARDLRDVKWRAVMDTWHQQQLWWRRTGRSLFSAGAAARLEAARRRPGRRITEETRALLADIAESYLKALEVARDRPGAFVAEEMRHKGWQASAVWVRDRVRAAREQGFLTSPPRRGVGGGSAGPALLAWRERDRAAPADDHALGPGAEEASRRRKEQRSRRRAADPRRRREAGLAGSGNPREGA